MRRALLLLVLLACKKPDAGSTGSAAPGSGSSAPAAVQPAAKPVVVPAKPAPGLTFETDADSMDPGMAAAFDKKVPRLPAISAEGAVIANFESEAGMPSVPAPMQLVLRKVGDDKVIESLPLTDDDMVAKAGEGSNWPPPAVAQQLKTRGAAVAARLRGFASLEEVRLQVTSNGDPQPTKIGELVLTAEPADAEGLIVTLRDGHGTTLHRESLASFEQGTRDVGLEKPVACSYRPMLRGLYRDPVRPAQLYVWVGYRYAEGCDASPSRFVAFAAAPDDSPEPLVTQQLDLVGINALDRASVLAEHAVFVSADIVTDELKLIGVADHAMDYNGHDDKDVQVTVSRDGKSAWGSELAKVTLLETNTAGRDVAWRASDAMVKTPAGWRIAALAWTEPVANAKANAGAKAGKLTAQKLDGDPGDASLREAFAKLTTDGVDAAAAARPDLVAIGSGPGERTVGGAALARAWNAAWKGKLAVVSSRAQALPSGTTGWVAATVELAKPGYKLPFTVFAVFDKTAGGAWSLVHIHFAVANH